MLLFPLFSLRFYFAAISIASSFISEKLTRISSSILHSNKQKMFAVPQIGVEKLSITAIFPQNDIRLAHAASISFCFAFCDYFGFSLRSFSTLHIFDFFSALIDWRETNLISDMKLFFFVILSAAITSNGLHCNKLRQHTFELNEYRKIAIKHSKTQYSFGVLMEQLNSFVVSTQMDKKQRQFRQNVHKNMQIHWFGRVNRSKLQGKTA